MDTIKKALAVAVIAAVPLFASPVGAVEDCDISNTGPGSTNECTVRDIYTCEVTENNEIIVRNDNEQTVASGTATNDGNNEGGNATSGTATNENGTVFNVEITNEGCDVTTVTQPEPETPVTPTPEVVKPPVTTKPTVLANTAGDNTATIAATVLGTSVLISTLAYVGSKLYRQSQQ